MPNFKNSQAGFINLAVGVVIGILVLGSAGYFGLNYFKEKKGLDFGDAPESASGRERAKGRRAVGAEVRRLPVFRYTIPCFLVEVSSHPH